MRKVFESLWAALQIAFHIAFGPLLHRRRARWGATADEITRHLPGDEIVSAPTWSYNHAITINAPRAQVWPWLLQLGQGRGGFYSYVFDDEGERARFAENVAAALVEHGLWLSLIGSTEGAPRDEGPPRRSARDVINAIEPSLEIVQLRSTEFNVCEEQLKSWLCLSRKRAIAAQPSTRR